jgi:hypothetical protein
MRRKSFRPRLAILLVAALVVGLAVSTVAPRGDRQPAAAAAAAAPVCNGETPSADCFQMKSMLGFGDFGLGSDAGGTYDQAPVQSLNTLPGSTDWAMEISSDGTYIKLRNLLSANLCLTVSASVHDGHLADCTTASRFRIAMQNDANVVRFVRPRQTHGGRNNGSARVARPRTMWLRRRPDLRLVGSEIYYRPKRGLGAKDRLTTRFRALPCRVGSLSIDPGRSEIRANSRNAARCLPRKA